MLQLVALTSVATELLGEARANFNWTVGVRRKLHATPELLPSFERAGKLVYVARDPRDVVTSNFFFMGTPADGWDGSMRRFCAPADETPNAFGPWPGELQIE